jgi:hypothetical protein
MDSNDLKDPSAAAGQEARMAKMNAQGDAENWFKSLINKILRR